MSTQLTLFEASVVNTDTYESFYQSLRNGLVDNISLEWACKRAFLHQKILFSIIPVDELTIIPAWRDLCEVDVIPTIEASPYHNLYVKIQNGHVVAAAPNIKDIVSIYNMDIIYNFMKD